MTANRETVAAQPEAHATEYAKSASTNEPQDNLSSVAPSFPMVNSPPKRKPRLNLLRRRSVDSDSDSLPIPSLPHTSKRKANSQHRNGTATSKGSKASRYILMGRVLFIACLALAAALLSCLSWRLLTESERKLADSHFDSLAERALTEAAGVVTAKRWSTISMASIVSEVHPYLHSWPFVTIPGYDRLVEHLLNTTGSQEVTVMPILRPDQLNEWEQYMFEYYDQQQIKATLARYYGGVWSIGEGECLWGLQTTNCSNFTSSRDTGPNLATWEYKNILAPMAQASRSFQNFLLYNIHSHPPHAQAIDRAIDCVAELAREYQQEEPSRLQKALDYGCATLPYFIPIPTFVTGPSSIIFQPIRVGNDRDPEVSAPFASTGGVAVLQTFS